MDADFLAIYRIDLRDPDCDIDAETFFTRVFRLFAYRGVIREELQVEMQNNEAPAPTYTASPEPSRAPVQPANDGTTWVEPDQMKHLFPDLF